MIFFYHELRVPILMPSITKLYQPLNGNLKINKAIKKSTRKLIMFYSQIFSLTLIFVAVLGWKIILEVLIIFLIIEIDKPITNKHFYRTFFSYQSYWFKGKSRFFFHVAEMWYELFLVIIMDINQLQNFILSRKGLKPEAPKWEQFSKDDLFKNQTADLSGRNIKTYFFCNFL